MNNDNLNKILTCVVVAGMIAGTILSTINELQKTNGQRHNGDE